MLYFHSNVSQLFVETITNALNSLPWVYRYLLASRQYTIFLSQKILDFPYINEKDLPKGYALGQTYKHVPGLCDTYFNRILIGEYFYGEKNTLVYHDKADETLYHEIGHALDEILENFSYTEAFKLAYLLDVNKLKDRERPYLEYYLQGSFADQASRSGCAELFAELYTHQLTGKRGPGYYFSTAHLYVENQLHRASLEHLVKDALKDALTTYKELKKSLTTKVQASEGSPLVREW